ncbi:hypothetical protein [Cytobacillus gottheilii]
MLSFIERKQNPLIIGTSSTGKTHLERF